MSTFILPLFSSSFQKSVMLQKLPITVLGKILSAIIEHDSSHALCLYTCLTDLAQHKKLCYFILSEFIIL